MRPCLLLMNYSVLSKSIPLQVYDNHQATDGKLHDYCDGTQYKSHLLFQTDPHALQIILHFDELELCNPLGTKSSLHKVGTYTSVYNQNMKLGFK